MVPFLWGAFALLISLCLAQGQQCYFADGSPADEDYPCVDDTSGPSPCCGSGSICLTSGLCFDGRGLNRGSCTDQSWQSNQCAQYCTQYKYSGLWPCDTDGNYACLFNECSSSFYIPGGRIQVNDNLISSLGLDGPTATVTSAADTVTATETKTARASQIDAPQGTSGGVSTGTAAGIGAGIGIPLAIAAAAFGALFLMEKRKRQKLERSMSSQGGHTTYDPYYKAGGHGYQSIGSGQQPSERDNLRSPQELDNQRGVPELQGNAPYK